MLNLNVWLLDTFAVSVVVLRKSSRMLDSLLVASRAWINWAQSWLGRLAVLWCSDAEAKCTFLSS